MDKTHSKRTPEEKDATCTFWLTSNVWKMVYRNCVIGRLCLANAKDEEEKDKPTTNPTIPQMLPESVVVSLCSEDNKAIY